MDLYAYQRPMWLAHFRQLRRMIREGRQVLEARLVLRAGQRRCAEIRRGSRC